MSLRRICLVAGVFSLVAMMSTLASAQPGRGPGGFGGDGGLGLLLNPQVREELQIVDDQQQKLQALAERLREEVQGLFGGLRDLPEGERRERFEGLRERMQARQEEMQRELRTILLPHQVQRLEQLNRQQTLRFGGVQGALRNEGIASQLGITDEQREKIRERAEEVAQKLAEQIAKARQDAEDEVIGVLTPEQRAKWKELFGERFELGGPGGGGGFGGQGGFGARPGQGGPGGQRRGGGGN